MYDKESVARRIKSMGVDAFIALISSPDFSIAIKKELEKIHIFCGGYPCISMIYRIANL